MIITIIVSTRIFLKACILSCQQRKGNGFIFGQEVSDSSSIFDVVQPLIRIAVIHIRMGKCGGEHGDGLDN
jgi:hypothetical protein